MFICLAKTHLVKPVPFSSPNNHPTSPRLVSLLPPHCLRLPALTCLHFSLVGRSKIFLPSLCYSFPHPANHLNIIPLLLATTHLVLLPSFHYFIIHLSLVLILYLTHHLTCHSFSSFPTSCSPFFSSLHSPQFLFSFIPSPSQQLFPLPNSLKYLQAKKRNGQRVQRRGGRAENYLIIQWTRIDLQLVIYPRRTGVGCRLKMHIQHSRGREGGGVRERSISLQLMFKSQETTAQREANARFQRHSCRLERKITVLPLRLKPLALT